MIPGQKHTLMLDLDDTSISFQTYHISLATAITAFEFSENHHPVSRLYIVWTYMGNGQIYMGIYTYASMSI